MKYKKFEALDFFDIALFGVILSFPAVYLFGGEYELFYIFVTCIITVALSKYWQIKIINTINRLVHTKLKQIDYQGHSKKRYKLPSKNEEEDHRNIFVENVEILMLESKNNLLED
jgi:hypothetical protein